MTHLRTSQVVDASLVLLGFTWRAGWGRTSWSGWPPSPAATPTPTPPRPAPPSAPASASKPSPNAGASESPSCAMIASRWKPTPTLCLRGGPKRAGAKPLSAALC